MNIESIESSVNKGQQSLDFKEVLKLDKFKIRISIKSDSYKHQCFARIDVWNELKWNNIHSLHYNEMNTKDKLIYSFEESHDSSKAFKLFKEDREKLLKIAKEVLF